MGRGLWVVGRGLWVVGCGLRALGFALWALSSELRAQSPEPSSLRVVVTAVAAFPLENAVVSLDSIRSERFTNSRGEAVFPDVAPGSTVVRVRRIGYLPKDTTVEIVAGTATTVSLALDRVAIALEPIRVVATELCRHPGPPKDDNDIALIAAFAQLRINAAQYLTLAETYPFNYLMRNYHGFQRRDSTVTVTNVDSAAISGVPQWKYAPGAVISRQREGRRGQSLFLHLPTVEVFADPAFIASHCFHNGGVTQMDTAAYFRIDFVAAEKIRTPDIEGSIYLDTETLQVRRSVVRLSRLPAIRGLTRMEVTTLFSEVLPSIPLIRNVSSRQVFDVRRATYPVLFEEQRLVRVHFLKGMPGDP